MADELEQLKDENRKLKGWEWRAIEAERRLNELKSVAGLAKDQAMGFVTSRVIANSSGPFVRSALVNVGEANAVKVGYPALSAEGLAGRVVEVGRSSSQVLYLTDLNSKIPVHVGPASVRAIVAGDNGPLPRLNYLPALSQVQPGDEVSTSGIGGIYPRGLRVGVVVKDNDLLRVKPYAELDRLEFLSVLFYENPTLGLIEEGQAPSRAAFRRGESGLEAQSDERR
jgi:rod shape-determining protein MreC